MSDSTSGENRSEIETLIEFIRENPFPEELEAAKIAIDEVLATPTTDDIIIEKLEIDGVPCQMLKPVGADENRLIIYLHGGGYAMGSLVSHAGLASEIGKASNCYVLQVDYRLAPEHVFPAPIEDSCTVYRWLLDKGYDSANLALAGDSAGGGLVIANLVALRDAGVTLPAAAVCISPWTDLAFTGESIQQRQELDPIVSLEMLSEMAELYMAGQDPKNPGASPLFADMKELPPLLIQVGESEILFSDSQRLAKQAEAAGVDVVFEKWPEMIHVWHLFYPMLTEGRTAISRIGEFIREHT